MQEEIIASETKPTNKVVITAAISLLFVVIFILGYRYLNEDDDVKPAVRANKPDTGPISASAQVITIEPDPELKTPGVLKAEDGYITTNAYTKQEKFHPFMDQVQADQVAARLATISLQTTPETAGTSAVDTRDLQNKLLNSFYRYKEGKAEKMGNKEIGQILSFEATFPGFYEA